MAIDPLGSNPDQPGRIISYFASGLNGRQINITPQVLQARQWILQNIIGANLRAGNPILTALTGGGHVLFTGLPGRIFQIPGRGYYHNSGTDDQGRYVPPMYVSQTGRIIFHRLRPFADRPNYARPNHPDGTPERRQAMREQSIQELDLGSINLGTGRFERGRAIRTLPDGRRVFNRQGFVGEYTERRDGGIEFGNERGGSHTSGVVFRRQIHYAGANAIANGRDWFEWGQDIPPSGTRLRTSSTREDARIDPDPPVPPNYTTRIFSYPIINNQQVRNVSLAGANGRYGFVRINPPAGVAQWLAIPPEGLRIGADGSPLPADSPDQASIVINQNGTIVFDERRSHNLFGRFTLVRGDGDVGAGPNFQVNHVPPP